MVSEDRERKRLILEIERWIEYSPNIYAKAAFYGDDEVVEIVERLYKRWQDNGCRGVPLDYATIEELRILAAKAQQYRNATLAQALKRSRYEESSVFEEAYFRSLGGN